MRPYVEILPSDIGRETFHAFNRVWGVDEFIGRIMSRDVGKRVYKVGDIVQVENDEQRAERDRKAGNEHRDPTWANQLWQANKIADEKGIDALDNPHGMIGRACGCGDCFTCAAAFVVNERRG